MKISTKTRYGLRALIYIAENTKESEGKLVRIKEISEAQNLSVQYLEQILFKLKKNNIIEGKRGPCGGYKLSRDPGEISVMEVFKVLETSVEAVFCDKDSESCVKEECRTFYLWNKLNEAMTKILEETTVDELMKRGGEI